MPPGRSSNTALLTDSEWVAVVLGRSERSMSSTCSLAAAYAYIYDLEERSCEVLELDTLFHVFVPKLNDLAIENIYFIRNTLTGTRVNKC
jgi:hypothetical protein